MSNGQVQREEDLFAHTRMDLGSHIEELRGCLWRALKWFILAMVVGIFVAQPVLVFIASPINSQLRAIHQERFDKKVKDWTAATAAGTGGEAQKIDLELPGEAVDLLAKRLAKQLNLPVPADGGEEKLVLQVVLPREKLAPILFPIFNELYPQDVLKAFNILDGIFAWLKVAMYCGFVLAAPMIFWEIWSFVAAGLYPQEKALVYRSLPLCIGLFLAGVALCQFVLLPMAVHYLLGFNAWLGLEPELRLNDWLSFAIFTPIIFGVAFQTPLVMFVLDRIGILSAELYIRHWRIATFIILVLSAFMAPAPDPVSMMALGVPILALYWLGILMCKWWPRPKVDLDVEEPEEAVEV